MNRYAPLIGIVAAAWAVLAGAGCGGRNSHDADASFLDTTIAVSGQGVSFASSRQTLRLFHLTPQVSAVTGDTLYSDTYLVALACTVKVVGQSFKSLPAGGPLHSPFLRASLILERRLLDSAALSGQSGADAGWTYRVAPEAGKTGLAGKAILAARGNRGLLVTIGVTPDSLAAWQSRIDALAARVRFD